MGRQCHLSDLNDSVVPLSDSTMPINVGGTIYLPYFMLDANQNGGIRLGIINGGQDKVKHPHPL